MKTTFELQRYSEASITEARESLTFLSLNIAHGRAESAHQLFLSKKQVQRNLKNISEILKRERVDIAALQEVDATSIWNGAFSHIDYLAKRADFCSSLLGDHMRRLRLRYGTALLSKYQLSDPQSFGFRTSRPLPRKGVVFAAVKWPGRSDFVFDVVSLHLDFLRIRARLKEVEKIVEICGKRSRPVVIMGDFNCEWDAKESAVKAFVNEFGLKAFDPEDGSYSTFALRNKRWDWILLSKEFEFVEHRILKDRVSDHRAVLARVRLANEAE